MDFVGWKTARYGSTPISQDEEINGGLPFVTNVDLAPALRQRFTTAIVAVRALYAILLR